MSVQPDFFTPSIIDLSSGNVQGIETSRTNPRVVLDPTGVYVTNAAGGREVEMSANGGINMPVDPFGSSTLQRAIRWMDAVAGMAVAQLRAFQSAQHNYLRVDADAPGGGHAHLRTLASRNTAAFRSYVEAQAGGVIKTLIADDGTSDFVQWNATNARTVGLGFAPMFAAGSFNTAPAFILPSLPAGRYYAAFQTSGYLLGTGVGYFDYYWDGTFIGTPTHYFNLGSFHAPHVMWFVDLGNQGAGTHFYQVATNPANGTNSDANDRTACGLLVL